MKRIPITPALREALPSSEAAEREYSPAFRRAADLLLNRATLFVAGEPHRLAEVELYWAGPGHDDPFAHKDPIQVEFGRWYFHRQGGTYKGGTYKGLDIAAGQPGTFVGILIRALVDVAGTFYDGSCTTVDYILTKTGKSSVADLAGSFDLSIDPPIAGDSPLHLAEEAPFGGPKPLVASPRVGLTLKKGPTPERKSFLARPYRFSIEPTKTKKGRPHFVVGLYAEGRKIHEIAKITGISEANVAKYIKSYEDGRRRRAEDYTGDLSTDQLCELFGALSAR